MAGFGECGGRWRAVGSAIALSVIGASLVVPGTVSSAPVEDPAAIVIRSTPAADLGVPFLGGVTFDTTTGRIVLTGAGTDSLVDIAPSGDVTERRSLPTPASPATLSVEPGSGRMVVVHEDAVSSLPATSRGKPATKGKQISTPGLVAAEFDQLDGRWVGLTADGHELTISDRAPDEPGAATGTVDLSSVSSTPLTAVAPNPADGLVWVLGDALYGVDGEGNVASTLAVPSELTGARDMVFAPSSDQTDPESTMSLFVVEGADAQATGSLAELTVEPLAVTTAAAAVEAALVRVIDMSQLQPPSPDSSGIVYLAAQDRLMVSDSEVEEMSIYSGTNLYKVTRAGALTDSGTTVAYSEEPTGLGYQPSSNTLLVSDDDADRVFKDSPGNDGRHGTVDDVITSIPTSFTGNNDCEDVTYFPDANHVFTIDGVNREVYRYEPSGAFVAQFDVGVYGALDPEGIVHDPSTGTLFVLDDASTTIYQVDMSGNLVQTIGIGAASAIKAAGIAVAPASNGSGVRNLYIVDRGVDNDGHPDENDGAIYEMSIPGSGQINQAPVVNAGADQTITLPSAATLSGTASDDGRPAGAALANTWSTISGPGTVTFADPSSPATSATFTSGGVYVLRLTSSDSAATSFDDVQITVTDPNAPSTFSVAINSSTDDAEEYNYNGNVNRTSADIELVDDGTTNHTVGLRFTGVNVPPNATITSAHIQFTVDEITTAAASLVVRGERSISPVTYSSPLYNVSSRPDTAASVAWSPGAWSVSNAAGPAQRTPNIAPVVQEIIGQPGWSIGNPVAFTITGSGVRTARAFDSGSGAAQLVVEYTIGAPPANQAPIVDAGVDQSITLPAQANLNGTVSDDGRPTGSTVSATWSTVSGPGTVTFGNANAPATTASFSNAGTYDLRLTATDGALTTSDVIRITVAPVPAANQAPTVDAGVDQSITLPAQANLNGTVSDDGLPAGSTVSATWSTVSGPGTVTFGNANAPATTASFSTAGTYDLRLTATDGALTTSDVIRVIVAAAAGGSGTLTVPIRAISDDAEEINATGAVDLKSSDLEITTDGEKVQTIGLRFTGVNLPPNAVVTNAYLRFTTDKAKSVATSLNVFGVAQANPTTFTTATSNVSSRPRTSGVPWVPAAWTAVGQSGAAQETPNLTAVINEIKSAGWVPGNAMAFTITGTGVRQASSYGFGQTVLVIEYTVPTP